MTESKAAAGYFCSGLPYNRSGHGSCSLIVFQGLLPENKPQPKLLVRFVRLYKSDDYAKMIREEFGGPIDVIGVSTGDSIDQHFAADHPDQVRRLVIHSSAYGLSDEARRVQMRGAHLAQKRRWVKAYAVMLGPLLPDRRVMKYMYTPILWLASLLLGLLAAPKDPADPVITIEAEDGHDFKDRLGEILAPTLVIAGERDPYYTQTLFRETAEGIGNARLIIYPGMGHPASGNQFGPDVLAFLEQARR